MTYELPKTYDFKNTEQRIYAMWEAGGYFQPHRRPQPPRFRPQRQTVRHLHPPAQRHRRTASGSCHVRQQRKT